MAARVQSTALTHFFTVFQCCPCPTFVGTASDTVVNDICRCFKGYETLENPLAGCPVIKAAPGVLCIDPGDYWENYIAAAQVSPRVEYTIKNTTFTKQTPEIVQCADVFPAHKVTQQGTPNIRLWWPLMYECPSTVFTLTILYGTPVAWDDDGPLGPNPPAWVHAEQWQWHVDADLDSLRCLLYLFHEIPFGKDEVPLISDEPLFKELLCKIDKAEDAFNAGDLATAAEWLSDFELEVMDACILDSPLVPNPTGLGTGIANSEENPACCKLLCDVEYILQTTGIGQPSK
jgi:hypothetical protein